MQSATTTLTNALKATVRYFKPVVLVDWLGNGTFSDTYDDMSSFVEGIIVDRSLTSDVPDEAQLTTGFAAAEATITLGSDLLRGQNIIELLSPLNTSSPLWSVVDRIGRRVTVGVDVQTTAGMERVLLLTGSRSRELTGTRGEQTVTLTTLDRR
jgi:hypothetical protein